VPDLAIVSRELFEAAQERAADRRIDHPSQQRRPKHILSGLLRCAACGSGMSTNGKDKAGRIRIRCSAHAESGMCPDPATFYLAIVERAVLSGLRRELRHPEAIAEWVKTYHAERKRLASRQEAERTGMERRVGELGREIDRLVNAIAKGHGDPTILGPQSTALYREKTALEHKMNEAPAAMVALHPGALKRYEQQVARLEAVLGATAPETPEDAAAIRELVQTVTVHRDKARPGGVEVVITGRLNALFGEEAYPNGSVECGERW
jgi:hypothetical protein